MHALWFMIFALCVLAIAYRFYSAFIAARVLMLNDARLTPAHQLNDGQNFHPTNKWVLFGHHFAAITGAGPLVGPVLAAQFGFLPGYLWILIGVCLGGAVHDFVILTASVRRGGRSLAEIARDELGPVAGFVAALAILFIVIIAIAGLGRVVVGALAESAWGVFAIGVSIPLALLMGLWIYRVRGGSTQGIREASVVGVVVLLLAVVFGKQVQDSSYGHYLVWSEGAIIAAIALYGFLASVLPVWMLLCPRDYLSSYLKIGTIFLLIVGICVVNPLIEMPMFTEVTTGISAAIDVNGERYLPVVKGSLFPFVFITIACGAISGFHSLVSSGTTPKMINKETDCRTIGYGSMLMEGLVAITALLAATSLPPADYFAINTDPMVAVVAGVDGTGLARSREQLLAAEAVLSPADRTRLLLKDGESVAAVADQKMKLSTLLRLSNPTLAALGFHVDPHAAHASELSSADFTRLGVRTADLPLLCEATDEVVAARTGGAVSLAVGMARVFSNLPKMNGLLSYWYHFAIMFEALFILTTIDTGTRVARFVLQEMFSRAKNPVLRKCSNTHWVPGSVASTLAVVLAWSWFISSGNIAIIWPMFGIANQLLASVALVVATTLLLKEGTKMRYALVTALPLLVVGTTTLTAGVRALIEIYLPMAGVSATAHIGWVCTIVTSVLMVCVAIILGAASLRWAVILRDRRDALAV